MAGQKGICWPGQRLIQERLGCNTSRIKIWTDQLVKRGYVRAEGYDQAKHPFCGSKRDGFVYFVSSSVSETGNGSVAGLTPVVLPQPETGGVASTGNEINRRELTKVMKGNPAPDKRQPWQIRKDLQEELVIVERQIKEARKNVKTYTTLHDGKKVEHTTKDLKPEAQESLRVLIPKRDELKASLIGTVR